MFNKKFLKQYYFMLIPGFIWLALVSIVPMFGIIMAFQNYNPIDGILKSQFVGLENFRFLAASGKLFP